MVVLLHITYLFLLEHNLDPGSGGYGPGEKRRKPMQMGSLTYLLEDSEINEDLKIINKNKQFSVSVQCQHLSFVFKSSLCHGNVDFQMHKTNSQSSASSTGESSPSTYHRDTRIEEGKLFYEKRWFRRGQSVQVEQPKNGDKFPAMISAIGKIILKCLTKRTPPLSMSCIFSGTEAIWVRKTQDSSKMRIYLTQLTKGKYVLKRRAM